MRPILPNRPVLAKCSLYMTRDTGELLPLFATAKTRSMEQHMEQNELQLTCEENCKVNPQSSRQPTMLMSNKAARQPCASVCTEGLDA